MEELFGITRSVLLGRARSLRLRYPGEITPDELRAVILASGGKCCWCSKDVRRSDLTIEHLGVDNSSLAVACFRCNSSHKTGFKSTSDIPPEVVEHRANTHVSLWKASWKRENRELYKALRRAEYLRRKAKQSEYYRLNSARTNAGRREHYKEKHDTLLAKQQAYREANKARIAEQRKQWRAEHPEEHAGRFKEWYDANKSEQAARVKAYREANREKVLEAKRAAYQANAEKRRADAAAYREAHRDEINAKKRDKRALAKAASA